MRQAACSPDTPVRRPLVPHLVLVLGLLFAVDVAAHPAPTLGERLCVRGGPSRQAARALRFVSRKAVDLDDRLVGGAGVAIDVTKTRGLCLPIGSGDASPALASYAGRIARTRPAQAKPVIAKQRVTNRFGTDEFKVKGFDGVLIPSAATLDAPPAPLSVPGGLDTFACYQVERSTGGRGAPAAPAPLALESALGTWLLDVKAPTRLCVPADLDAADPTAPSHATALACYRATLARTKPRQGKPFPRQASVVNRFGGEQLTLTATVDFCVPSDASAVGATVTPTPTQTAGGPTPTAVPTIAPPTDFTLRIDPASAAVDIGTSAHLKATAVFANGDTADFTERVVWSSSSEAIEAPNLADDRGRVDAVDAGSAVIAVLDVATGVTSTAIGADAVLTVNATLERLELQPVDITRGVGESFRLRAVGHFAGGYTRSIAKRVIYASSDPDVGKPTNDVVPSEHARVLALAEGTVTLSATDPISGLTSTASGDDVALTVVPPLERCTILNVTPIALAADHEYQLTARGFYPGGFERNLTQQVVWASAAPDVLEAPNTEGDRSRVKALLPGDAEVTATDSVTGRACDRAVTFQVRAPREYLGVYTTAVYLAGRPRRVGDAWQLRALEFFTEPPFYKYITEKVVFSSSKPDAVLAPNTPGNRGRLLSVGSGTAEVIVTDPVTGRTSYPIALRGLDGLTRVEILHRKLDGGVFKVPLGSVFGVDVLGHFADGPFGMQPAEYVLTSDNPAVIEVLPPDHDVLPPGLDHNGLLHAIAYGVATISAVDTRTGISSAAFGESIRLGVPGPVERVELVPAATTRRVGESHSFAAVVHYEGGVTENATQYSFYESSNPAVAVATNGYGNASQIQAVAPGTTVIDATDFRTGASSADTGDGAVLPVVGPLQRLRVEPTSESRSVGRSFSFTAIGTDADGREINLTQSVTWSSSDPAVAIATNEDGNRSRVQALAEGTTTIAAFDPVQGLSSSATGDDATFAVSGILDRVSLGAETTTVPAGGSIQLTATGHLVGGTTINLTQEVEYTSSDPTIAKAENTPGDRSGILAVAPGTVVMSALDPGTGKTTAPADRLTLTIMP